MAAAVGLLMALGVALRLPGYLSDPLWVDEVHTLMHASDLAAMIRWSHNPLHPPLSYLLVYLTQWLTGSESDWALRLPSLVASILTIPAFYLAGRSLFGSDVGLIAALLATVDPILIDQGEQARMYSLYALFAALVLWHLGRYQPEHRDQFGWWMGGAVLLVGAAWSWGLAAPLIAAMMLAALVYLAAHRIASISRIDLHWPYMGAAVLLWLLACHVGLITRLELLMGKVRRAAVTQSSEQAMTDPAATGAAAEVSAALGSAPASGDELPAEASADLLAGLWELCTRLGDTLLKIIAGFWQPYGLPGTWLLMAIIGLVALIWAARVSRRLAHWTLAMLMLAGLLMLVPMGISDRIIQPRYLITAELGMLFGVALAIAWVGRRTRPIAAALIAIGLATVLGCWGVRGFDYATRHIGPVLEANDLADRGYQTVIHPSWPGMLEFNRHHGYTPTHHPGEIHLLDPQKPLLLIQSHTQLPSMEERAPAVFAGLIEIYQLDATPGQMIQQLEPHHEGVIWIEQGRWKVLDADAQPQGPSMP